MIKRFPSKEEQILSLLEGKAFRLLKECIDYSNEDISSSEKRDELRAKIFTVTPSEVLAYVRSHYSLDDLGVFVEDPGKAKKVGKLFGSLPDEFRDGLNVIQDNGKYKCFYFNDDIYMRTNDSKDSMSEHFYLNSEDEIYEKYVNECLSCDGLGPIFRSNEINSNIQ